MKGLIGDLEAYVNLEETERAPTDLGACLDEVVQDAVQRTAHYVALTRPEDPALVDGYPTKLRHVFAGILDNAITASTDGRRVHVTLRQEGVRWMVTIVDAGTGMSGEMLARVFDFGISPKKGAGENWPALRAPGH